MDYLVTLLEEHYDLAGLGGLLTFLTILITFYNQVAKPMYDKTLGPVVNLFSAIISSPQRITSLDDKLDLILDELKPNSGGSIKDTIMRLDKKLSLGEEQRLLLLNTNPHGIWVSDDFGRCTWTNDTLRKAVNAKDFSDLTGENWINCVHPSDRRMVMEEWESAVENARDFNLQYRLIDMKSQVPFNVHGIAKPARDYKGSLIGFNGVLYFL